MRQIRDQIDKIVERLLVFILMVMVINILWQVFTRFFIFFSIVLMNHLIGHI